MLNDHLTNRINATIECPLKMSTIVWSKCEQYRGAHGCLCHEARDRLKMKGQGVAELQGRLQRLKRAVPTTPQGWGIEKLTRFYIITDAEGNVVHRATNQAEAEDYLQLVSRVKHLEEENRRLWAILRDELVEDDQRAQADELLVRYAKLLREP
jgi:hypothetical protein